jgi:hypothetical protein
MDEVKQRLQAHIRSIRDEITRLEAAAAALGPTTRGKARQRVSASPNVRLALASARSAGVPARPANG